MGRIRREMAGGFEEVDRPLVLTIAAYKFKYPLT